MATAPRSLPDKLARAVPPLLGAAVQPLQAFFRLEAASGIVLLACAAAALAWANLGGARSYRALLEIPVVMGLGVASARFTVHALVNDGLMTVFFFVVGMEIKRELVLGELRKPAQAALPAIAALGGMAVPAGLYLAFNRGGPGRAGWGIPMATDIAFCIGVLTLLGRRVPRGLVVFVTALAIFDDVGGIAIIALFYGSGLRAAGLLAALAVTGALVILSRAQVRSGLAYAAMGGLLWAALHHGGVHPTIAGVVLGLAVPTHARGRARRTLDAPLARFVQRLHPWVAFAIMPAFALANSGVDVRGLRPEQLLGPVAVGTAVALLLGKVVGVFSFTALAVRTGVAPMPGGASPGKLLGASVVTGIGFTVALFIAGLAFPGDPELLDQAKVGILGGSLLAGLAGALILRLTRSAPGKPDTAAGPAG